MIRNVLTASVATAAMIVAVPALAHPGAGGGGAGGPSGGASMGAMSHGPGGMTGGGSSFGQIGSQMSGSIQGHASGDLRDKLSGSAQGSITAGSSHMNRGSGENAQGSNEQGSNQQGSDDQGENEGFGHASLNGIGHSSLNSSLNRGALPGALLPGLSAGLSVQSSTGASVGTVTNVITSRNGAIAGVVVTAANGQTYRVPASALSISGNVVTINTGQAFESGSVPSALLPGLSAGLAVNTSTGASLGTVASVQTGKNGAIGSVTITGTNGQTITVPANALSISGNVVTVNAAEAFERTGVPSALLPGLTTGLTVNTTGGASFGTVSQVMTGQNGAIQSVVVTSSTGQKFVVPASALTINGNVVTVANASEAFEGSGVPSAFLPGLSTGLTVNSSGGASVGTISQVVQGSNGTISAVVVTSASGQLIVVPASDLSISGSTVTVANAGM